MKKITRKLIHYILVGWKAQGLPKGFFWCGLTIKAKKGGESADWKGWPKRAKVGTLAELAL